MIPTRTNNNFPRINPGLAWWLGCLLLLQAAWLQAETALPDTRSMRQQALQLERGAADRRDNLQAFHLYCLAAGLGDSEAYYSLGWMYFNGRGVPRNLGVAMSWFQRASKSGDLQATNFIQRFDNVQPATDSYCPAATPAASWNRDVMLRWVKVIAPVMAMDPALIAAVIQQESSFNYKALSHKHAQGLMQLMPATAKRFGVADAWHPVQNMLGGSSYLRWLLEEFDGQVPLALAAYNAGEAAVRRYKGIPPYKETRNYVKRIMAAYGKQTHPLHQPLLYPEDPPAQLAHQ